MPPPSESVLRDVGQTIRKARRDRDLSQEALANAVGIHPTHVSEIERGRKDIRLSTLMRVIAGLGMTPGELFALFDERAADRS